MSLQGLLENALGKRFPEDAAWNDPQYLKQKFSREQLSSGLVRLSQTKRGLGAAEWSSLYSVEDYDKAREMIATARDFHPRFRKLSAAEMAEREGGKILAQGSGTPESFYKELQWEQRERDKEGRQNDGGLGT
jgi:hypothetical protein